MDLTHKLWEKMGRILASVLSQLFKFVFDSSEYVDQVAALNSL